MFRNALVFLFVPVFIACNRTPEPDPAVKTAPSAAPAPKLSASAPASQGLAWDAPSGWSRVDNPSPMRKATYKVPKQGEDAEQPELAVSVAGGSVDANADRWVQQFDPAAKATLKKSSRKSGTFDVTVVELTGNYQGNSMPGAPQSGPKQNYALLGAIVPVDANTSWFFKMIGPAKSVAAARADFDALIGSLRMQ